MRGPLRLLGAVVVIGLVFAAGWWAANEALSPPEDPIGAEERAFVEYTVVAGEVGRSLSFAAVAEWPLVAAARSGSAGVVTSVGVEPGASVADGDVLYTVGLRPVVAAEGTVPAFRDLTLRSVGEDVAQLQRFLVAAGFYDGEVDGVFGTGTRTAVRGWQDSLGVDDDGVVRRGDVVFLPVLPAEVVMGEGVVVGAELGAGEVAVRYVTGPPRFHIPLSPEQRPLVPLEGEVVVSHDELMWPARVAQILEIPTESRVELVLEGADGGAVCGDACVGAVPLGQRVDFPARIVVVPETAGPVVPMAAITTDAAGSTTVTGVDGATIPIEVVVASDGLAVVDGLAVGDVIRLPVTEDGG
ncbi:hypothetical protein BH24ACT7_BH24ACT7_03390 [soil metagenome]